MLRNLFAGKGGEVKIYPAPEEEFTHASWEILVDLEDEINDWGDHGLLSSQLHPDFPAEPYLFLFYSVAPEGWTGECERIINGLPFCEQNAVLERLKIDVAVDNDGTCSDWSFADSDENRVRLMEDWCSSASAHHNAAMEFYTDGSLLVANGDSAQASFDRGYPAEDGEPVDLCYLDGEKQPQGYFKSQNDAFLQGHLIRIHAEAIMYDAEDLPLTDADYDIWAKGLRNPFRLDVSKATGDIYIADVGHITVEEINILRNPLEAAASSLPANFGWPCVEGDGIPLDTYNWITYTCDANDDNDNCDICEALFACTAGVSTGECDPAYVAPSFQYDHSEPLTIYDDQENLCGDVGNSVSAVAFFEGRLYAADYSKKCLWYFESDSSGTPDLTKPRIIAEGMGAEFVDLVDGGDGYLYGTNFALSKLTRIDPENLDALEATTTTSSSSNTTTTDSSSTIEETPSPVKIEGTSSPVNIEETPSPVNIERTPSPVVDATSSPIAEVLKAPVARLRGLVHGICFSPCEIEVGTEIRFTAQLSGAYGDNNNITEYAISFGDGSEGYAGPVGGPHLHTYESDGVFLASVTVTDSEGLTGTETMTIVVGEPFSLEMSPESGKWVVGDTIQFNLTRARDSTVPDSITWASKIEHCTTDECTGEVGCHVHSLQDVDTAEDSMSGSVVSVAHPLPSQVIISAQMIFDTTVIDYEWPTSALIRTVTTASVPAGLAISYGDVACPYTPCEAPFMSGYPAMFEASSIQSTENKIYEFVRWEVTYPDDSTETSQETALSNLEVDLDGLNVTAEYQAITPTVSSDISSPIITAVGGYYTKLAVEWASISEEGVDRVIAYAATPDHDTNTYQSSKAVLSDLTTSTELLVPAGESNFTVYLRAYNSVNNTISAKSSEYLVVSAPVLDPSDSLCPEDLPAVAPSDDDDDEEEDERSSPSPVIVELSPNASVLPGIVQAEDFDAGGEGVAYHDNTTHDEGGSNYRKGEGVDLERNTDGVINVGWTEPGEWISYTVQYPGNETAVQDVAVRYAAVGASNGIALALDLEDPSECPELEEGGEQVIMLDGNLLASANYSDWKWTQNTSVALAPGPHVVTLCFIGNAVVNVDLLRFGDSECGNGICQWTDGEETCSTCPQDCGECPTPYTSLVVPGTIQAEDFDLGGEGVGFFENECVSSQLKNCTKVKEILSDYRNESHQDGLVELRETDDTISWGWTSSGEWLGYSLTVTAGAEYNVTLRYASSSIGKANLFLNAYSCDIAESKDALLGSAVMPDSGGEAGPFSRTVPFTTRLEAGRYTIRLCVASGGFTLDEITFDPTRSGTCNDDGTCDVVDDEGCESCQQDCTCSEGEWYGLVKSSVPGFVEAYTFDEGSNGVAYYDDTEENLGNGDPRSESSVDIEVGQDGTFHVAYGIPGEWLKYTVLASESGLYNVTARYATLDNSTALSVTVDDGTNKTCDDRLEDSVVLYSTDLPSSGGWDVWIDTNPVEVALPAGPHVFKLCILNAPGASDTNLKGLDIQVA
eukprot:g2098.t1